MPFIPLNVVTERSLDEDRYSSIIKVNNLMETARELGYSSLGISDFMTYSAVSEVITSSRKYQIEVIVGVKIPARLLGSELVVTLYPKNELGLREVLRTLKAGSIDQAL